MNYVLLIPVILGMFVSGRPAFGQANRYDVFAQTIAPFVSLFATDAPKKAMRAEIELLEATGLDPKFAGAKLAIALEMPDRLLLSATTRDDLVLLCRKGQEVWAFPGEPAREILSQLAPGMLEAKGSPDARIRDFSLPFPRKQLVFLPALFAVEDVGEQKVEGLTTRVLDVALLPELAESMKAGGAKARLWIGADRQPVRIQLSRGDARVIVAVRSLSFEPSLPKSTWTPPEESPSVTLTAGQCELLLDAILKKFK